MWTFWQKPHIYYHFKDEILLCLGSDLQFSSKKLNKWTKLSSADFLFAPFFSLVNKRQFELVQTRPGC